MWMEARAMRNTILRSGLIITARVTMNCGALDMKVESYRRELLSEIHRVEQGLYGVQQALSTDFARLEKKVVLSLGAITARMDLFRHDMQSEILPAFKLTS